MASVASPYGMRPVQLQGGLPYASAIRSFTLTNNSAKGFFFGDPVGLNAAGDPCVLTASPTATASADSPIGVFMGCEWQDPIRGFINSQYFPAGAILAGATQVKFKILDSPIAVFKVQSAGSVPLTAVGENVAFTPTFGAGSVATGDSNVSVTAATGTGVLAVKIIGFLNQPGSAPGDAFTDLLVIWNAGIHRYTNSAGF